MNGRRLLAGMLAVLGLAASPGTGRAEAPFFPVQRDTLFLQASERVGCLSRSFVLRSTVRFEAEGRPLVLGQDVILDADAGCFTLATADTLGIGRRIVAVYQALPLELQGTYRLREDPHRRRAAPAQAPEGTEGTVVAFTGREETAGLDISGSKTFGIEVGNRRDLKLRQSLDLRLTGQVTGDVSLLALLSDQDIPFQPEGNTAELEDLDRVLVQIRSPRAGASLGDISLIATGMNFLEVNRELEGFSGEATLDPVQARGAVASAKGEFTSRQFFGQDGKQGPYRLTDRTGNASIVIVAGSERIWLDGALLTRGEEQDYVIDYALGEITFTSRRVITANSEITVDYQFATGRYQRRVTFGAAGGSLGGLGTLTAAYFREGDDANDPFGGALSPAELEQLAVIGDSARIAGGTGYVGPGNGDYELVIDPQTGETIFVFVDGTGDYDVTFVNIGEGKGEYEPEGEPTGSTVVYTFVGPGQGRYVPRRDLPAPEERQIADLRWGLARDGIRMSVEGALSRADGNVLSPLDDEDNDGGAVIAEGALDTRELGGGFTVTPRVRWRRVDETFRSPGRVRPGFFSRDWNLTGTEEIRGEDLKEAEAVLGWSDRLSWKAEAGRLALADTFTAVRQRQTVRWQDRWVDAQGAWTTSRDEVADRTGRLNRRGAEVTLRRWAVQPRVKGLIETRRRTTGRGERHRDWETALVFPVGSWPLMAEIGGGRRLDDSLEVALDDWSEIREARRGFGSLEGRWQNLSFLLRYEARRVTTPGSNNERRDTGRLDLRHQAVRGAWNAVASAEVGTVGLRQREKLIEADSTGFFDQFGNYVGAGGGYDVQFGPPGDEVLTGRVDLSTRLRWSPPGREAAVPELLRKFAWEGFINLTESSALPLVEPKYFLSPGSYLDRASTLDGRVNIRQTVDLFPAHRSLGLRLREELRRRLIRSPSGGGGSLTEIQNEDDWAATLRSNPAPGWDAELEGGFGTRREEVDPGSGFAFIQDTRYREGTVRGGRRFRVFRGSGRASSEVTYSAETGEGREALGWVLRPRVQWSLSGVGRVDIRYARTRLSRREGFSAIQGAGAPRLNEGWRFDTVVEVRVNRGIVVTGAVGVDQRRGLSRVTEGRMEVRGSF